MEILKQKQNHRINKSNVSKKIVALCFALFALNGFSQTKHLDAHNKHLSIHKQHLNKGNAYSNGEVTDLKIELKVESLKELEKSFKIDDLDEIFTEIDSKGGLEFKITCLKKEDVESGITKQLSYKVTGGVEDREQFFKNAEKIYEAARKYYIN
ncbi:hypothetical protein [uncultured Lacinutrix sp.]|uniref:hypothetical protein n=1 Tax=uncultured Lacinutrix sp. TaxID=574032 RepID=UPI002605B05C|nr:hypothetical protein [uncultured Lacinutrix sp.]